MRFLLIGMCLCFLAGCATTASKPAPPRDKKGAESALESVAAAISGKELSPEEVKQLKNEVQKDPEAQSAIKAITNSVSGHQRWKYSPATGKRYAPNLTVDPETGVPLKWVDE